MSSPQTLANQSKALPGGSGKERTNLQEILVEVLTAVDARRKRVHTRHGADLKLCSCCSFVR